MPPISNKNEARRDSRMLPHFREQLERLDALNASRRRNTHYRQRSPNEPSTRRASASVDQANSASSAREEIKAQDEHSISKALWQKFKAKRQSTISVQPENRYRGASFTEEKGDSEPELSATAAALQMASIEPELRRCKLRAGEQFVSEKVQLGKEDETVRLFTCKTKSSVLALNYLTNVKQYYSKNRLFMS